MGLQAVIIAASLLISGCSLQQVTELVQGDTPVPSSPTAQNSAYSAMAEVLDVKVTGNPGAYTFAVTVQSPDTGCEQYADWWEVITQDGKLLYRRILLHSHVDEQPFNRNGGPVKINLVQEVIVRAHMNTSGYGSRAMQGTVEEGFTGVTLPEGFAAEVAQQEPLPSGCAF